MTHTIQPPANPVRFIMVFDNRRKTASSGEAIVVGFNEIARFNLPSRNATTVFAKPLTRLEVRTMSQGLTDAIPGSSIMIEETDFGRLVKLDELRELDWLYVNRSNDERVWILNWSRYIPNEIEDAAAEILSSTQCAE